MEITERDLLLFRKALLRQHVDFHLLANSFALVERQQVKAKAMYKSLIAQYPQSVQVQHPFAAVVMRGLYSSVCVTERGEWRIFMCLLLQRVTVCYIIERQVTPRAGQGKPISH